ncbi:Uma2 family endonuclease [Spirulina subsalsa FACHB-351]|uniref:Uma2 family endonuclease n=1 Tax=Spirulina subsalsa FACHB-351 TaxID=234711 RepID=A0ABT3L229_9CYAN|nr:Uma2 family endonuclease [Spirulina subsalsa]MCW6035563.1 Uma2 family endonuclease [Spirulina subsalsa FACHB-351]
MQLQSQIYPPLENGDRLSYREFERRYSAMPTGQKAELIEGVVYMASPLRFTTHAKPHADLIGLLWTYKMATPGTEIGIEPTVRLDSDNEFQPDGVLLIPGGSSQISPEGYIQGVPELVVEIAASSAAIDLGDKQRVYRRNGVQEYLVWQIFEQRLDWFYLEEGVYQSLAPNDEGILCSRVFPGLWLNRTQLLENNLAAVLETLQTGLASPEHQAFIS